MRLAPLSRLPTPGSPACVPPPRKQKISVSANSCDCEPSMRREPTSRCQSGPPPLVGPPLELGRTGAAMYELLQFAPGAESAALEAACEAIELLDAWVTP